MKSKILLLLFICFHLGASSQTIDIQGPGIKIDSIPKNIVDSAQFEVSYLYTYATDPKFPENKKVGTTLLQIGTRYNRFCDFNELLCDSISDLASRGKISTYESIGLLQATLRKVHFKESIMIDKQTNQEIVQRAAALTTKYQYEEPCPILSWTLVEGDTTIAGYQCSKAKTSLFGRDYVAWYSPQVDLPYGPYKFNGLPGLVFRVTDTQGQFDFVLDGFQKVTKPTPIYMWTSKDIVKSDRKTIRQIYKNFCADPGAFFKSETGGVFNVSKDVLARIKPKPYNPIELE